MDDPHVNLPNPMPLAHFKAGIPDPAHREALSPGIMGPDAHKNIHIDENNMPHVKLAQDSAPQSWVHPEAVPAMQQLHGMQNNPVQALAQGQPPPPALVPVGELIRRWGTDVVNTMYPGIFQANGYLPYLKQYGANEQGMLQVPDPTANNPAFQPPPQPPAQPMGQPGAPPMAPSPVVPPVGV